MNKPVVVNLFAGPGAGKCFKRNTKILMYDGTIKNIQDINPNEEVMGWDSKPRKVTETVKGHSKLYKIIPTKGKPFTVNGDHVLVLCTKEEQVIEVPVIDFIKQDREFQAQVKLIRTGVEFKSTPVPIDPYFIGLWLGDGTSKDQSVTTSDIEVINFIKKLTASYKMKLTTRHKRDEKAITYYPSNGNIGGKDNALLSGLRKLNLLNNKHVPDIYKINSREVRLQVLAGLIDSDGTLTSNCFYFTNTNKKLANGAAYLARSLGFASYVRKRDRASGVYYSVGILGHIDAIPTKIQRKQAAPRKQKANVLHEKFTVKPLKKANYYGITIDKDHKFLLGDFTITHNSTTAAGVFSIIKMHDINAELITEFAKDLTWEKRDMALDNQIYVFGKQHHKMRRVMGQVDVMITDSPLWLSYIYTTSESGHFHKFIEEEFNKHNNLNFVISRSKKYNPKGRNQTYEQAIAIDCEIMKLLKDHHMPFEVVPGDYTGINTISKKVLEEVFGTEQRIEFVKE